MLQPETKKILNLGCGDDSYGTHRIDRVKTSTTTYVYDVENGIPYSDCSFDEVYSKNLLEHLRNVGFHLEECKRVLKDEGILTLITDNAPCLRYYVYGTHTGRYEKEHSDDHHFGVFTINHLKNHLEASGLKVVSISLEKTDTNGKYFDCKLSQFTMPRIKAVATK